MKMLVTTAIGRTAFGDIMLRKGMGIALCLKIGFSIRLVLPATLVLLRGSSAREDVYNLLWAVVFGFATLNILSLAARRVEPNRRGLSFGEMMAVLVVVLSMFLLGWELLTVFHIFPIKLRG